MKRLFLASLFAAASCVEAPLPPPQAPTRPELSRSVPLERQARDPAELKMECQELIARTRKAMDDPFLMCASNFNNDIRDLSHVCRTVILQSDFDALQRRANATTAICGTKANCSRFLDTTQAAITKASATCAEADLKAMEDVAEIMDRACEKLPEKEFPLLAAGRVSASLSAALTRDNCELDETIDRVNEGLPR